MTLFWFIAGLFMAVALLFILPPLLRQRKSADAEGNSGGKLRETMNVSVYRDQFAELDADLHNGILSQEQYDQGKQELQQRLLQDVPVVTATGTASTGSAIGVMGKRGVVAAAIVGLAVPLLAVLLYVQLGNPKGLTPQTAAEIAAAHEQDAVEESRQKFVAMVDMLAARLKDQPQDAKGWAMLARSYAVMERFNESRDAYAKLLVLTPNSPEALSDYADVLAMTNNGQLAGKPVELINQALRLDPKHPKALALAGAAAFEQKNFRQAAIHWGKLLTVLPADSQMAQSIAESIAEAKFLAANEKAGVKAQAGAEEKVVQAQEPVSKNSPPATAATTGAVSGTVTLSPALAAKASPGDTLFIFARASEGPKMPLAILRLQAKNLPAAFSLDDAMAMSPAMKLSSFPEVVVGARISKSGNAMPQPGDLQGFSQAVKIGDKGVKVVIDQQMP